MNISRNYSHIDEYLNELAGDIYIQPSDDWHSQMSLDILNRWIAGLPVGNVLDVGCGADAIAEPFFSGRSIGYTGISLGGDVVTAQAQGKNVLDMDMSFLSFDDNSFDLIWARHVLEHSPFPLLTLMEWHRVSSNWLCLIMPNPAHFTYVGRNHYSVMTSLHTAWLLRRAGWKIAMHEFTEHEFRFLCTKQPRLSYEGYVEAPLDSQTYEFEKTTFA